MGKKPVRVKAFGKQRTLGEVEGVYLTDVRSIVEWMLRGVNERKKGNRASVKRRREEISGESDNQTSTALNKAVLDALQDPSGTVFPVKRPRFTPERALAAENALRDSTACPYSTFDDVLVELKQWYEEAQTEFSASNHYDAERAQIYTERNTIPQKRLTNRCLDLISAEHASKDPGELILDVACGSGLCVASVRESRPQSFVVGIDSAPAMLELVPTCYADTVLADMTQGLPFRDQSFDWALSVSAIHFVREPEQQRRFFSDLASSTRSEKQEFSAQFFPANQQDAETMRCAAHQQGWGDALLVLDQSHHRNSVRTYLRLRKTQPEGHESNGLKQKTLCSLYTGASCFLQSSNPDEADEEHRNWLRDEHARFARSLMRKERQSYESALQDDFKIEATRSLGHRLIDQFQGQVPDLETVKADLDAKVLPLLHSAQDMAGNAKS
mmetsp:Transcript_7176/g.14384  ORF Transcript_7176/g.14384 Transcript_7176/m.14384 type:complete len:443 (-) Transcript_7176:78-1406(-)|eukprot:CAMPEP_0171526656 /NCGR_PEP_ID=MMETSP0959-20130129/10539_1 /TAXON_ID=87120 /ORGANISM="Aurantiochytrium limacinum, Strain ATCCMYA-1381" /LENGTH=442 /DNA_ID=CAMNT_0012068153 /DNA_START=67 /DNA_END=1395 /DNA_ORIENTATION=-